MSPITAAARERLEVYLRNPTPPDAPPREPPLLRRLIDDLIAAVRGEQKDDLPF